MERPTEDDLAALAGRRVRLVVPKPREDMRLVGRVATEDDDPVLYVDGDPSADRFGVVRLQERDRDAVLRAYRNDGTLLGRVRRLAVLEKSGEG
jgi:hypothetical protein